MSFPFSSHLILIFPTLLLPPFPLFTMPVLSLYSSSLLLVIGGTHQPIWGG